MKRIFNERDEALAIHYMVLSNQIAELSATLLHVFNLQTNQESTEDEDKEREFIAYRAFVKIALGDMLCQTEKICEILDLDFEEARKIGSEKNKEKEREFLEKHPNGKWF